MSMKTSIGELAEAMAEPYVHLELGQVNDHAVYILRADGEFPMHRHTHDEMYIILEGELRLEFINLPPLTLKKNDSTVVRAYTTHQSIGNKALVMMVKPKEMFASAQTE